MAEKPEKTGVNTQIYVSHTLSAFGDRMWSFGVGFCFVILFPDSLLVAAIYGVCISSAIVLFGGSTGRLVDANDRLTAIIWGLFLDNVFVAIGSTLLAIQFLYQDQLSPIVFQYVFPALVTLSSIISQLASVASTIIIERDWIVILSKGNDQELSLLNSRLRSIDLTAKILGPLFIAQMMSFASPAIAMMFLAAWNIISLLLEYLMLHYVYEQVPELKIKALPKDNVKDEGESTKSTLEHGLGAWKEYFSHEILPAGLGFAFVFLTVMGFDNITLGYIYSQGGSEAFVGVVITCGGIAGVLACIAFPYCRTKLGEFFTLNLGFGLNVLVSALCVASVFIGGSPFDPESLFRPFAPSEEPPSDTKDVKTLWNENLDIWMFVFGIVLGRFGLWLGDLSVSQFLQTTVVEDKRGIINGIQNSLNKSLDLLKFFFVILIPSKEGFGYLIILSWIFLVLGWIAELKFTWNQHRRTRRGNAGSVPCEETPLLAEN